MGLFLLIARSALLAGLLLAAGCNMWAGLGKDVQQMGKGMENSGKKQ
jgi:predicted small secreted protein